MIKLGIKEPGVKELKLPAGVEALVSCANAANCVTLDKNHVLEHREDGVYLVRVRKTTNPRNPQ